MNKDTFVFGLIVALVTPFLGYGLGLLINFFLEMGGVIDKSGGIFQFTLKLRVLVSIIFNLIPFQIAQRNRWDNMLRAVGVVTILLMFGWAFHFNLLHF